MHYLIPTKKKTLSASIFYGSVGDHVLVQNMVEAYLSLDWWASKINLACIQKAHFCLILWNPSWISICHCYRSGYWHFHCSPSLLPLDETRGIMSAASAHQFEVEWGNQNHQSKQFASAFCPLPPLHIVNRINLWNGNKLTPAGELEEFCFRDCVRWRAAMVVLAMVVLWLWCHLEAERENE